MPDISPDQYQQFLEASAEMLDATSNANRLRILKILLEGEISVSLLAVLVGLSPSALSQHLAVLRRADLVLTRKDRTVVYYRCEADRMKRLLALLESLFLPGNDISANLHLAC